MLAALLSGCSARTHASASPAPNIPQSTATQKTITPVISLAGIIAPLQNVAITSTLSEPATAVYVSEGDRVRQGQVLAQLSTADLEANLESYQGDVVQASAKADQTRYQAQEALQQGNDQVRSAQAAVNQAQQTLQNDDANLQRDRQLLAQGYIAQQQYDQQQTQVRNDEQAVSSAQAALATARENQQANGSLSRGLQAANLQSAAGAVTSSKGQIAATEAQIAKATIVSPVDGVVVNRNLNTGEYPGNRQIFTIQAISTVYAELSAYSSDVAQIPVGTRALLSAQGLPGHAFGGRVVAVLSPTTPNSSNFVVKVQVPNPSGLLRPGLTVSGQVRQTTVTGVAIPVSAFVDDTHHTIVVVTDGTAHSAHVSEVADDGHWAIVTGLGEGARVVSNGTLGIADGQRVTAN